MGICNWIENICLWIVLVGAANVFSVLIGKGGSLGHLHLELRVLGGLHVLLGLVLVQSEQLLVGQVLIQGWFEYLLLVKGGHDVDVSGGLDVQLDQDVVLPGQQMISFLKFRF